MDIVFFSTVKKTIIEVYFILKSASPHIKQICIAYMWNKQIKNVFYINYLINSYALAKSA